MSVGVCAAAIPAVYYFGEHNDHSLLVMELLGPSLEELFNECGRKFSKKTVLMLADQMVPCACPSLFRDCSAVIV